MAITSYTAVRTGNLTEVTVVSSLSGTVYYHWYLDGVWVGVTTEPTYLFWLDADEQARVEVLDSNDPDFDYVANAPAGYPARKTIWWCRVVEASQATLGVDYYRIDQRQDAGDWLEIGRVYADRRQWDYRIVTGRLDDLSDYEWRVVPIDRLGNDGTPHEFDAERVVRTPDAPEFTISYDDGTQRVTFAEAA